MTRTTLILIFALVTSISWRDVMADDRIEFFEKKIRPVLVQHCYQCHSTQAKNVRGGLLLDSQIGMKTGGESGELFSQGKPEESLLISSLRHESFEMPPDQRLPEEVIADFEKWISDGAADPRKGGSTIERREIDLAEGRKFWSFQPIVMPEVPQSGDRWSQNNIDRFIAKQHADNQLQPQQDASALQMVRRLHFTLTGLPPTVGQIQTFEDRWAKSATDAISQTCDELLESRAFGERWGRHWLDVVRFAESSGGGRSLMFPHAWRFREYVIQAFNDDKPFNQLIKEHIAGDLLSAASDSTRDDQLTGSGYLALGPTNYELQDKELLEMEVIDEQIDTMGRTFLGLTLGCARCHDHKFDPVPTKDYYALAGIFRSTKTLLPGNVSSYVTTSLTSGDAAADVAAWTAKRKKLERRIATLTAKTGHRAKVAKFIDSATLPGIVIDDSSAIFEGNWVLSEIVAPFIGKGYRHDDFKKSGCRVRFETELPEGTYSVRLSHNYTAERCVELPVSIQHADGVSEVRINQAHQPPDGVFTDLGSFRFSPDSKAVVSIDAEKSGKGVVIVDAVQFLPIAGNTDASKAESTAKADAERLKRMQKELRELDKQKPEVAKAMSVQDKASPADGYIHVRGAVRNKGKQVARGFVSVAGEFDDDGRPVAANIPTGASGRQQLAEWLVSEDNPLTTRVYVNRVWLHLIGEGLVRTPDNFGRMGQLPSHPQLLDYLAASFAKDDQWSTKRLIRRIVNSRTFRLSSEMSELSRTRDPDNLLLTRAFRRRLEAEAIRDSLLQISGQLDLNITGRTIARITQYDNGYKHQTLGGTMRSVYVPFFRNAMLEIFDIYDVANPNLVSGQRNFSTLPAQALYMLNSPEVLTTAESAATSFLASYKNDQDDISKSTAEKIDRVYMLCLARLPTSVEREQLQAFLKQQKTASPDTLKAWTAVFQALFASVDFRYID